MTLSRGTTHNLILLVGHMDFILITGAGLLGVFMVLPRWGFLMMLGNSYQPFSQIHYFTRVFLPVLESNGRHVY